MESITFVTVTTITISPIFTETSYWVVTTDLLASGQPMTLTEGSIIRNTPVQEFTLTKTLVGPATTDPGGSRVLSTSAPTKASTSTSGLPTSLSSDSLTTAPSPSVASSISPTTSFLPASLPASVLAHKQTLSLPVILSLSVAIPLLVLALVSLLWLLLRYKRQKRTYKEARLVAPRLSGDYCMTDTGKRDKTSLDWTDSSTKRGNSNATWSSSKRGSKRDTMTDDWDLLESSGLELEKHFDNTSKLTRSDFVDYTSRGTSAFIPPSDYNLDTRRQTHASGTTSTEEDLIKLLSPQEGIQAAWDESIRRLHALKESQTTGNESSTLIGSAGYSSRHSSILSRKNRLSAVSSADETSSSRAATRAFALEALEGRAKRAPSGYSASVYSKNALGESICDPEHEDRESAWFNLLKKLYNAPHGERATTRSMRSNEVRGIEIYKNKDQGSLARLGFANSSFSGDSWMRLGGVGDVEKPLPVLTHVQISGSNVLSLVSDDADHAPRADGAAVSVVDPAASISTLDHISNDMVLLRPDVYQPPEPRGMVDTRLAHREREESWLKVEEEEESKQKRREMGKEREMG